MIIRKKMSQNGKELIDPMSDFFISELFLKNWCQGL